MKISLRIAGIVLLVLGLIWMVYIMGGVFSRSEWTTSVSGLVGPLAFHAICMALGAFLVAKPAPVKSAA